MSFLFSANAWCIQSVILLVSFSGPMSLRMSESMSMAASFAPPWSLPLSAAMAPVIPPCMSARVPVMTRAVKVEAL